MSIKSTFSGRKNKDETGNALINYEACTLRNVYLVAIEYTIYTKVLVKA